MSIVWQDHYYCRLSLAGEKDNVSMLWHRLWTLQHADVADNIAVAAYVSCDHDDCVAYDWAAVVVRAIGVGNTIVVAVAGGDGDGVVAAVANGVAAVALFAAVDDVVALFGVAVVAAAYWLLLHDFVGVYRVKIVDKHGVTIVETKGDQRFLWWQCLKIRIQGVSIERVK